jgi:hypothetical protein
MKRRTKIVLTGSVVTGAVLVGVAASVIAPPRPAQYRFLREARLLAKDETEYDISGRRAILTRRVYAVRGSYELMSTWVGREMKGVTSMSAVAGGNRIAMFQRHLSTPPIAGAGVWPIESITISEKPIGIDPKLVGADSVVLVVEDGPRLLNFAQDFVDRFMPAKRRHHISVPKLGATTVLYGTAGHVSIPTPLPPPPPVVP